LHTFSNNISLYQFFHVWFWNFWSFLNIFLQLDGNSNINKILIKLHGNEKERNILNILLPYFRRLN